jgi:molybdopterin/thiamine biosynthesis adenylyltransferase
MLTTLVIPEAIALTMRELLDLDVETGAVLLVRSMNTDDGQMRLLARELHLVPEASYLRREKYELLIASAGYVPALGRAEATSTIPIWFHTHPGKQASPQPSPQDRRVDDDLAELFQFRSGTGYYGALIFAGTSLRPSFTGFLLASDDQPLAIDRILVVGSRLELFRNHQGSNRPLEAMFDRNVRAFGGEVQRALGDLKVAIVGAGGTGSCVAEQLVRLGVRKFLLVDPDRLSISNVTRVYGSAPAQVGEHKVAVLQHHLLRIAPEAEVETSSTTVTTEPVARRLCGADVIFGCTDDNAGRLILSRLATYMAAMVIDCGVVLSSETTGRLDGIFGRVTVLHPGAACLVCRDRIDLARARSEMMAPEERRRLEDEGYAPALPGVEPAVVAFTTAVASMAVAELLERMTSFGPEAVPTEMLLRIHDREISTNNASPRRGHYCHPDSRKIGLGMTEPFLEQVWPT